MSGVGSVSGSSTTSGTLGDAPPVSFPGIASGIDYNSIIQKYTAETLAQEKPTEAQITNLNSANTAVLKIQNLIGAVQDTLTNLSDPTIFGAFKATVANTAAGSAAATATQISGSEAIPGTYTILAQTAATTAEVINSSAANAKVQNYAIVKSDNTGVPPVSFATQGTSITPTNGTAANGRITLNGVTVNYDVATDTLQDILNRINSTVPGVTATYNPTTDKVTVNGVTSVGSGGDSGNLLQVLKLDTAQLISTNPATPLSADTGLSGLTAGTYQLTINGTAVNYTVGATPTTGDSINSVVASINAAGIPGVTASVSGGDKVVITGALSITDTGSLASALDLTPNSGSVGSSAAVGTGVTNTTTLNAAAFTAPVTANGTITINGTAVAYTTGETLGALVTALNTAGATASFNATTQKISLTGVYSITDSNGAGGALAALNVTPQTSSTASSELLSSVTSSSTIGGLNANALLNATGKNGFANLVTGGTFTINGVQFTVNPTTETLNQVISQINSSAAGVTAYYNTSTASLSLTNTTPGPQSIVVGSASDTSNFLQATGLAYGIGANPSLVPAGTITTASGQQASVTYQDASGNHTVYSNTNSFTNVIPGINLSVTQSSPVGQTGTFYTVSVAADPTQAEKAINSFVTAYNAAIDELNKDTKPPSVVTGTTTSGTQTSASTAGGVLYNNFEVSSLRDQLVQLVSGFIPSGSSAYNSLASVGLVLDTASTTVGTTDANDSTDSASDSTNQNDSSFTVNATSGRLSALDTTTFEAAYAANTTAVASLFTNVPSPGLSQSQIATSGVSYGFSYQFGTLLSGASGIATFLKNTAITPGGYQSSLLNSVIDSNDLEIKSLESQVDTITQEANTQANQLRAQYSASETQIAELQSLQGEISAIGH